jgi:peptide/nickel transport system substrate-binding protein
MVLFLVFFVFVSGCSNAKDNTKPSTGTATGGTFVYARPASVTSFDLHNQITSNNAFAIDKVFEPLVSFDSEGKIVDWLAKSHTISADGLTYTFVLRDGLKFSNGTDVTAEDAVFSLQRHLKVGGPLAIAAQVDSLSAQDQKTLVIKLKEPYTPFISELSNFSNGILPKDFSPRLWAYRLLYNQNLKPSLQRALSPAPDPPFHFPRSVRRE